MDSGATHDLKLLREDESPPRGTNFDLGSWKYGWLDFRFLVWSTLEARNRLQAFSQSADTSHNVR